MGPAFAAVSRSCRAFQSTHPVWDGTVKVQLVPLSADISIHPSRVGWDAYHSGRRQRATAISIHPSRVGWDCFVAYARHDVGISIHPSRVGWDLVCWMPLASPPISIHPSRVGWDQLIAGALFFALANFNPPIPCGMGPVSPCSHSPERSFQSTHPVWDGTGGRTMPTSQELISIHPSRVGWDVGSSWAACAHRAFQSTHPVWDGTGDGASQPQPAENFNPPIPCGMGLE